MSYFLTLALLLIGYMTVWFLVSLLKGRNDVADVAWGLGFVLIAWASFFISAEFSPQGMLVLGLVSIWGIRLAWHIQARHRGTSEDYRYLAWRKEWGSWFYLRSYLQVYLLQGLLLFIIALPIMLINQTAGSAWGFIDTLGLGLWLVGYAFEAIGDAQLAQFIKNPANKGKLMRSGLWQYSRHPNYFGEVTQWWGIWLIALSVPYGWVGIIGPMTITYLILNVSGVPLLENKMALNPEFADYKRRTSRFIPLPPRV